MDALFRIFEGFYFGPHHLIMASLIHFEEKVHKKKLQRATPFHYYFRGCCVRSLSIWAFLMSLDLSVAAFVKRDSLSTNQLVGYSAPSGVPHMVAPPMPPQPEQGELPAETTPPVPTPQVTFATPPTPPTIPPVAPTTSELSITISATEFRALVHTFQTLTTTHFALFRIWLRCVLIRTSRLLFSVRYNSTWDSCLCLSLTFQHPQRL